MNILKKIIIAFFTKYIGKETDIFDEREHCEGRKTARLFEMEDMKSENFNITTIADISDDKNGSVPCNKGDATKENPIYGVDKISGMVTEPYLPGSVDVMAVKR